MKKVTNLILIIIMIFSSVSVYAADEQLFMKLQSCYQTEAEQKYVSERVAEVIKELKLEKRNLYTKVIMIDEWLHNNIKYDHEKVDQFINSRRTAYSGLKNGYTVCVGYSQLAMEFCKQLGISCELVSCIDKENKKGHSMIMIEVGIDEDLRQWYYWDPTNFSNTFLGENSVNNDYEIIIKKPYYDNSNKKVAKNDYITDYAPTYFLTKQELKSTNRFRDIVNIYGKPYIPGLSDMYCVYYNNSIFYAKLIHEDYRDRYKIYERNNEEDKTKFKYITSVYTYKTTNVKVID